MSFGEESTRINQNRPTKFPTTAFSDKSHSNSKKVKKEEQNDGLD